MLFEKSEKNYDTPLEVIFDKGKAVNFFDLDTLAHEKNAIKAKSINDWLWRAYLQRISKSDFGYMTKGIKVDAKTGEGPELMLVGDLTYAKDRFVMRRPQMVIGSDRLELYEFLAHRREVLTNHNRGWMKLAVGATFVHAMLVQVPTLFSKFFGDEVTDLEKKLGSEDQSEMGLKMSRMKQNTKRNEL